MLFSFSSHYVSWEVVFTRGRPRSAFRCIPVTFPVSKAHHSRDGIPLRIHKHWEVLLFWHWASILFCICISQQGTCAFHVICILNHLPESNRIKTFPWKHYLFYSYNTTLVVCACLASAQMVTFQHQLNWCGLTPIFTVPGTSSHFRAAVIHISLAAERRTLDIPHCMTHSCLLKS